MNRASLRGGATTLPLLLLLSCGPKDEGPRTPGPARFGLDGTWFVLYEDDPLPYLDVAFTGDAGAVARATAHLAGPSGPPIAMPLNWNRADEEWQADCSGLGELAPGTWWVSRVEATGPDGASRTWQAPSQWQPYAGAEATPGFFSVADPSARRVRVELVAIPDRSRADPVLYVYRADDPQRWIAANDDRVTDSTYPAVEVTAAAGDALLIRVDGEEDDAGDYAIRVRAAPERSDHPVVLPADAAGAWLDREPDGPTAPVAIEADVWVLRSLAGPRGDSDWMLVTSP